MAIKDQAVLKVVIDEGAEARPLANSERFALVNALLDKGYAVARAVNGDAPRATEPGVLVLGRFSEARSGAHQIDEFDVNRICDAVEQARSSTQGLKHGEWKPWFPVIDYDRCTNCMQCLSFCLFGVYGVDDAQRIQVQNNDNCKTNCPACSRVCPEAAIMFPKYKAGPINGDVVSDSDLQREKMKIDISALLGGDVYSMLRERSEKAKSRFSKERDSDKALKERQKCLVKLAQAGDIPPEVLMSLPSPDEIQRRAEEAKAKAQAALANQSV
jgi:Pyruvate/2-oxoacid:ferredoxin oxidoreductase delta subunit